MISQVIRDYWKKDFPKVIDRSVSLKVKTDLINDIVGIRRSGKTYLMFEELKRFAKRFGKQTTIYINFENRKLFPLKKSYFNDIIEFIYEQKLIEKHKKVYLFLDEIQRFEEWEKNIRGIYDEFKGKIKIFVSGSSANLLSKDYGELLTGRHLTSKIYPLGFDEFLKFKKVNIKSSPIKIKILLKNYLKFGGFPEVVLSDEKEELIRQLFSDVLSKDVMSRAEIRKEQILEEFAYYLSSNVSSKLSFNKMAKYFNSKGIKISVQTLENYFYLLKESFLFFDNTIFSYKVKDQLQYPRKIYCIDTGIANFIGFKISENFGNIYENAVAVELLRRKNIQTKIFYWQDVAQNEVDFVVKQGVKIKELIQVCYNISNEDTKKRELRSLLKASEELKCNNLLIITEDYEDKKQEELFGIKRKVRYVPLWKWLLEDGAR